MSHLAYEHQNLSSLPVKIYITDLDSSVPRARTVIVMLGVLNLQFFSKMVKGYPALKSSRFQTILRAHCRIEVHSRFCQVKSAMPERVQETKYMIWHLRVCNLLRTFFYLKLDSLDYFLSPIIANVLIEERMVKIMLQEILMWVIDMSIEL